MQTESTTTGANGDRPQSAMLAAALEYAAKGWPVFPLHTPAVSGCSCGNQHCSSAGKHPRTRRGVSDATTDVGRIKEWWTHWPDANIGIATGKESGLIVLDVDSYNGGDDSIPAAVPETITAITGGGGLHYLFRRPELPKYKTVSNFLPGLDSRADGGYIVAVPSLHKSGRRYEWEASTEPGMVPLADPPGWFVEHIRTGDESAPPRVAPTSPGKVVDIGRHGDGLKLMANLARQGVSKENAMAAARAERDRGRWTRDVPDSELARAFDGALVKYSSGEWRPAPAASPRARVEITNAADIVPESIRWLWPGWLARGKLHVLAGMPGTGKTTAALAWAAAITRGGPFPDGSKPDKPGRVLIWSGEDDPKDTLVPRLMAANADLKRVDIITGATEEDGARRSFEPARDMQMLADAIAGHDVAMIIVDSLVSAVSGDSHKNAEVRNGLQPLVDLAQQVDAVLVGITHYSKGTQGREPLDRVTGSLAFGALARLVFGTVKQQADDDSAAPHYLLARVKSNIGPDGGGYAYTFEQVDSGHGIIASRIAWGSPVEGSARDLIGNAEAEQDDEQRDASEFLRDFLRDGPMPMQAVKDAAKSAGLAWRTVQRAAKRAGVVSKRAGFGLPAMWMPKDSRATVAPFVPHTESGVTGANREILARMGPEPACDHHPDGSKGSPQNSAYPSRPSVAAPLPWMAAASG